MADQDETTLSLVFGDVETKKEEQVFSKDENRHEDDDSSLRSIESAIKQVLKCRETSGGTDSTANTSSACSWETRVRDDRLQASFDHRGGPDFKAQADSRSLIADLAVRAQPVNTPTIFAPADYYGRVSQRRGRCVVNDIHDDMAPIDLVTAVEWAPAQQVERIPHPRKHRSSGHSRHQKKQNRTMADERRFWLTIVFLGLFLNFLLVSGATALGLYLSGNMPGMQQAPSRPTPAPAHSLPKPTPAPTAVSPGRDSLSPTPAWPTSDAVGRFENATHGEIATSDPVLDSDLAPTPALFAPTPELSLPPTASPPMPEDVPPADFPSNEAKTPISPLWVSGLVVGSFMIEACILVGLTLMYRHWKAQVIISEATDGEPPAESPHRSPDGSF